jgi:hypothetical protein
LRVALRARARQLRDTLEGEAQHQLLVREVAYEQWHRLLFARFLEVNRLLRHPEYGVSVSLPECDELATELGEPDGWSVAGRFAAEILPGIFRPTDPCVRVRLAREDLLALERVVVDLPAEVFVAEDALGWVYQFWQSKAKSEVNASGRKVGGADLPAVTQLFTEHYMVRFLLENSLGAWWASRHPDSPLLAAFDYLRRSEDGSPGSWNVRQVAPAGGQYYGDGSMLWVRALPSRRVRNAMAHARRRGSPNACGCARRGTPR